MCGALRCFNVTKSFVKKDKVPKKESLGKYPKQLGRFRPKYQKGGRKEPAQQNNIPKWDPVSLSSVPSGILLFFKIIQSWIVPFLKNTWETQGALTPLSYCACSKKIGHTIRSIPSGFFYTALEKDLLSSD